MFKILIKLVVSTRLCFRRIHRIPELIAENLPLFYKGAFALLLIGYFSHCLAVNLQAQSNEEDYSIRIIFRGDDMGISHSSNQAIIEAYKYGFQKTAEVIVPGPWFPQAVRLLNENPGLDVGVHLTLTSEWENLKWRPLSNAASLTDSLGYFQPFIWPNRQYGEARALLGQDWKINDVENELRAQIETAKTTIHNLTHLTFHMGMQNMDPAVTELVNKLAHEYNLDINPENYNIQGLRFEDATSGEEKIDQLLKMLRELKPGNYLLVTHPDLDVLSTRSLSHKGYEDMAKDRQGDTDFLTSKRVQEVIDELGIEVISYSDLLRLTE